MAIYGATPTLFTLQQLILDVLARPNIQQGKISIVQAANSVQTIIYNRLLDKDSDLIASGQLNLLLPAYGNQAPLPADFVSLAERPESEQLFTDFMVGTITAFNSATNLITVNVTSSNGTDTLSSWTLHAPPSGTNPSQTPDTVIGTSSAILKVGNGTISFAIAPASGVTVPTSGSVTIVPQSLPEYLMPLRKRLNPRYLDEDKEHDWRWWQDSFTSFAWSLSSGDAQFCLTPSRYTINGNTMYFDPRPWVDVAILGKYNQQAVSIVNPTDTLGWSQYFYEIYKEGCTWICTKGTALSAGDPVFKQFIHDQMDSLLRSRVKELPERRTSRRDFI